MGSWWYEFESLGRDRSETVNVPRYMVHGMSSSLHVEDTASRYVR